MPEVYIPQSPPMTLEMLHRITLLCTKSGPSPLTLEASWSWAMELQIRGHNQWKCVCVSEILSSHSFFHAASVHMLEHCFPPGTCEALQSLPWGSILQIGAVWITALALHEKRCDSKWTLKHKADQAFFTGSNCVAQQAGGDRFHLICSGQAVSCGCVKYTRLTQKFDLFHIFSLECKLAKLLPSMGQLRSTQFWLLTD